MSEEKKEEKEPFSQFIPLIFEGRKAVQFWVRALSLEPEIATVQAMLEAKPERKRAVVPIVAEYEIDEKLRVIYVIQASLDTLGILDGMGLLYFASPEYWEKAYAARDDFADHTLKKLAAAGTWDEMLEIELKREE